MFGPMRGGASSRPGPYSKKPNETDEEAEFQRLLAESAGEEAIVPPGGAAGEDKLEGAWTCKGCGNVNYRHRDMCNTRKCGLPRCLGDSVLEGHPEGSWLCPGCGNINWKNRMTCHTRKCGMPFPGRPGALPGGPGGAPRALPGGPGGAPQRAPPWAAGPQGPASWAAMAPEMLPGLLMGMWPREAEQSPWRCPNCDNLNYANREVCNTRKCRLPRPAMAFGPAQGLGRMPPALAKAKISPMQHQQPQQQQQRQDQGGSKAEWTCGMCGNVNFGFRTVCNTRKCQAPRPF